MKRIAIITARGGSKRIPRKNIRDFCGKPMICYFIEAALAASCFDTVMVSTDDEEIADIAKKAGADVPFMRSEKASDDFATTADVLFEVFAAYEAQGQTFDYGCCIYPTAPFVTAEKLREAMQRLTESSADTLIPVVRFSYPPQRALAIENDRLVVLQPDNLNKRSQDLAPQYHDAGQFYCFRVANFLRNRHMMVGHVLPFEVPETEVQDIDNETDWQLAEMKYRMMCR